MPARTAFSLVSSNARSVTGRERERPPRRGAKLLKRYGEITAVDEVDVTVPAGDVYGLLGPNGAGKITLVRTLLGLIRPDGATSRCSGAAHSSVAWRRWPPSRASSRRRGSTPTSPGGPTSRSSRRSTGATPRTGSPKCSARSTSTPARAATREYSYGMVQRLGVAAALPRLLILDEPTNGLDPAGIRDMRTLIRRLAETGITLRRRLSDEPLAQTPHRCRRRDPHLGDAVQRLHARHHPRPGRARLAQYGGPASRRFGARNAADGELLVRLRPTHVRAEADLAD
jgi:ABC-2 type transport system ATP-binding protein